MTFNGTFVQAWGSMTRRMITLSAQACQSASGNTKSLRDDGEQIRKGWRLTNSV